MTQSQVSSNPLLFFFYYNVGSYTAGPSVLVSGASFWGEQANVNNPTGTVMDSP